MTSAPDPGAQPIGHEPQVRAEQVGVVFSQTTVSLIFSPLAAGLLCVLQWDAIDRAVSIGWFGAVVALALARLLLYRAFMRRQTGILDYGPWGQRYRYLVFLNGCVWGLASLIMFPSEPRLQITLMVLGMFGISAGGGISAYAVHLPTMLAFFVPVMLPVVVRLFSIGQSFYTVLACAMVAYCATVPSATRRINRSMVKSIRDNLELERLMDERQKAEQALAESQRRLQLITDNIPACIALVEADGLQYSFVNRRHLEQTGHTAEGIIGQPVRELL